MSSVGQQMMLASGVSAATISYIGLTSIPFDGGGNCSVSGVPIGAVASSRRVFMLTHWLKASTPAATLNSATIGGVAATIHVQSLGTTGTIGLGAAIISAPLPTGTTANVTLTFSSGSTPWIGTYRATGLLSATAGDTISTNVIAVNPYNGTINVTKQGILLFGATIFGDAPDYTVSGATENYESLIGGNLKALGSMLNITTTEAGHAVSISRASDNFDAAIVAAAFR